MNERYRLKTHPGINHGKPYYIAKYVPTGISKETGFWQQISPSFPYKYNALNFAKRHHITLETTK